MREPSLFSSEGSGWGCSSEDAIHEVNRSICPIGNQMVVCDHHDREAITVGLAEEFENLAAGVFVKIPGGFVREQHLRVIGHGPGDGGALPFAAREFTGSVVQPMRESKPIEQHRCPPPGRSAADPAWYEPGKHRVLQHRQLGKEVVELKDEADRASAIPIEMPFGATRQRLPVMQHLTTVTIWSIESTEYMHQRALARTTAAEYGEKLTAIDVHAASFENRNIDAAETIGLPEISRFEERFIHSEALQQGRCPLRGLLGWLRR
jgi:hypothetical protein